MVGAIAILLVPVAISMWIEEGTLHESVCNLRRRARSTDDPRGERARLGPVRQSRPSAGTISATCASAHGLYLEIAACVCRRQHRGLHAP